jgi:P4 family phage/plasmid primase-like protien
VTTKFLPEALYENGFADLVSIIPPGAQLVPSSNISPSSVGKVPGLKAANGLWHGYNWRKHEPTLDDVRSWCIGGANIGMRADKFPGVDIDCTDPQLAAIIEQAALAQLGPAPVRTGLAPKRLLMYTTREPFARMRLFIHKGDQIHLVEVLGLGQQYLVHGTHPKTLGPYSWNRDISLLSSTSVHEITRDQVVAFLDYLQSALEMVGCTKFEREGNGDIVARVAGDQTALVAPSAELLRQAVRLIPNTDDLFPSRDAYIKMGYAIRAACGGDEDEGESIFLEWAAKHAKDGRVSGNPETARTDWRRIKAPYAIGWPWIAEQARAFGFDSASLEFDALEEERTTEPRIESPVYSDQWLAERVVQKQRGLLRFVPQEGKFLVWDEGRWQRDAELLAEDIVKGELRVVADEVARHGATEKEKKEALNLARSIASAARLSSVLQLVKSDRAIAVSMDALDHDMWLLNTPGGLVDLKTGQLMPANPDALCTKRTAVPPDFSGACPEWRRFLAEATGGDTELERFLQRLFGYALTGSTREQQLAFIHGGGGNGKSVALGVLTGILADYARTASMDTFTASYSDKHSTDIAMLVGARLVTASETTAGRRWDEQRIKSLTGGEMVTARFMRQDNFSFLPQFKLIFVGNHKPQVRDVDIAMRRRIQIVPFTITPARVDKELGSKLREEWPAILAWMIEGCLDWQREGLNPPEKVKAASDEYFDEEDAVGRWLEECCAAEEAGRALTQDLFDSWREWANRNGEYVGTAKRLASALIAKRYERWSDPKTRRMGFKGIAITQQAGFGLEA